MLCCPRLERGVLRTRPICERVDRSLVGGVESYRDTARRHASNYASLSDALSSAITCCHALSDTRHGLSRRVLHSGTLSGRQGPDLRECEFSERVARLRAC
jgi:hypothetical protein